jgi:hypothetical protein
VRHRPFGVALSARTDTCHEWQCAGCGAELGCDKVEPLWSTRTQYQCSFWCNYWTRDLAACTECGHTEDHPLRGLYLYTGAAASPAVQPAVRRMMVQLRERAGGGRAPPSALLIALGVAVVALGLIASLAVRRRSAAGAHATGDDCFSPGPGRHAVVCPEPAPGKEVGGVDDVAA